jgi:predicted dithiol-disulfide oxidoreductase (DUF899 family)
MPRMQETMMSLPKIASRESGGRPQGPACQGEGPDQAAGCAQYRAPNLPIVEIEKDYIFDGPANPIRLIDMFEGRPQLIIYHFMFDPGGRTGARGTAGTDELSAAAHCTPAYQLRDGVTGATAVEREAKGADVLVLSFGTGFNYDFGSDQRVSRARSTTSVPGPSSRPGVAFFSQPSPSKRYGPNCFLQADGRVFHTYSSTHVA